MAKRILPLGLLLVGAVTVCLFAHQATAAVESQTSLLDTLQDLVSRLRTQRQDYYQQKARDDADIQQARENAALLETQLAELAKQEAQLDEQISAYQSEIQTLTDQLQTRAQMHRGAEQQASAFVAQQAPRIEAGLPYRREERLARLQAGATDANEPAARSAAEQLGHLWSYAQEELRLAGSSETYSDRASLEGDVTPYARYFRIGQVMLGYVTEDGEQTALWLPAGPWFQITDPGQAAQVRNAVEILDRRQAPDFVSLPIAPNAAQADGEAP